MADPSPPSFWQRFRPRRPLPPPPPPVPQAAFAAWPAAALPFDLTYSPDGRWLAVASDIGVDLYDVTTHQNVLHRAVASGVDHLVFLADGQTLALAIDDGTNQLWQVPEGRLLRELPRSAGLAFSRDAQVMALGFGDGRIQIWAGADGPLLHTLQAPKRQDAWRVHLTADGQFLVSVSDYRTLLLWRVADGQRIATLQDPHQQFAERLGGVAFAPDGQSVLAATGEQVRRWRVPDGAQLASLRAPSWMICVAVAPDSQRVATGLNDGMVVLWDVADQRPVARFAGHTDWVQAVAFAADGRTLASTSRDSTVRLWEIPERSTEI
ncbi:MAG TPA: WD40 repeat domain-containing protein [Chloroflexia bacterium]|nr:WD40 repeat domain-containing protein [Chloroflexia bacterium]